MHFVLIIYSSLRGSNQAPPFFSQYRGFIFIYHLSTLTLHEGKDILSLRSENTNQENKDRALHTHTHIHTLQSPRCTINAENITTERQVVHKREWEPLTHMILEQATPALSQAFLLVWA